MKKKKVHVWYDKKGDYLEINLKKCSDTYFNETRKDFAEIRSVKNDEIVGYALFNFLKHKTVNFDMNVESLNI